MPPRRLYTWRSPADGPNNVVRNQIDFILINKRFGTSITRACTYPGADVPSDHVLLLACLKIRVARHKKTSPLRKICYEQLRRDDLGAEVGEEINYKMEAKVAPMMEMEGGLDDVWEEMRRAMIITAESKIGYKKRERRRPWMTEEILSLMDERRKCRGCTDQGEYKNIHNLIRRKIRVAKNEWLKRECEEMESLQRLHDSFNLHKKIKETAGALHDNK